jgi:glutaredoxin
MWSSVATAERNLGRQGADREPQRSYGAIDVILYQTSWCPYCVKAREFLKSMGVSLIEHDIEKDPAKLDEMIAKSGSRGVPVVDIEGIIIRGYAPDAMRSAIERKRRD